MQINKHLLIVDDDERIRNLLKKYLIDHGYIISVVKNVAEAALFLQTIKVELIILDLMMPDGNGLVFAKNLREKYNNTPIIMLTAMGEIEDRVKGLEVGADDYLVKPFEPRELLLRISNIFKHSKSNIELYYLGELSYHIKQKTLLKKDQVISLTSSENSLLEFLIRNSNKVIDREVLAQELNISERSVDVQVIRLRSKIEDIPNRPRFLQTVRNQGYILRM